MKRFKKHSINFWLYKILREKETPEFIARGWAAGLFVNFFIPCFFQTAAAIPLAFLCRGSRVAAFVATFITNNFTIPLIYTLQCYLGGFLIGSPLHYSEISSQLGKMISSPSYDEIFNLGKQLFLAFFAGGALLGIVSAVIGYYLALWMTRKFYEKRLYRRRQKQLQNESDAQSE
jgi:uncharacterized protein (DUF2062 family)